MHSQPMALDQELDSFPLASIDTPRGRIAYRRAGNGPPLVLLHGIGSASDSWVRQASGLGDRFTILAWNAPGYLGSAPLPIASPAARDFGASLWAWLDGLGIGRVTLVGQSLGAIMATSATLLAPDRVARLVLLAPATGYGKADAALRESKLADRLAALAVLGPQGIAEKRGGAMLSPTASADEVGFVKATMARIVPDGYAQAARMLSSSAIVDDLARVMCPVRVASGSADRITPPAGCNAVAVAAGCEYLDLGPFGHACQLEAAEAVNHLLAESL